MMDDRSELLRHIEKNEGKLQNQIYVQFDFVIEIVLKYIIFYVTDYKSNITIRRRQTIIIYITSNPIVFDLQENGFYCLLKE